MAAAGAWGDGILVMKTSRNHQEGAETIGPPVGENESREPLFGDPVWVDERVRALQGQTDGSLLARAAS